MIPVIGQLAALTTSLLFAASSTIFTLAGRSLQPITLNRVRVALASLLLIGAHFLFRLPLPTHAGLDRWFWLGISGVVGLAIGDLFLYQAFQRIGPRLAMLLLSMAPVLASLLAWSFLGEQLSPLQWLGILVTLAGIGWVIMERNSQNSIHPDDRRSYWSGVLAGLGATAGQAIGVVTARRGLGGDFPALSATLMRMVSAALFLWLLALISGQFKATLQQVFLHPRIALLVSGGVFFGPFLGVTLSLVAIQKTSVGVASTLMALPPVFLLPIGHFLFKERFGWQAILGTLVAMIGVALLFLA